MVRILHVELVNLKVFRIFKLLKISSMLSTVSTMISEKDPTCQSQITSDLTSSSTLKSK